METGKLNNLHPLERVREIIYKMYPNPKRPIHIKNYSQKQNIVNCNFILELFNNDYREFKIFYDYKKDNLELKEITMKEYGSEVNEVGGSS